MLTAPQFRIQYPEFNSVQDPQLIPFLNRAWARIDPTVFGPRADEAHGLLTADLLALSPYGQTARMQSTKGDSTYGKQYKELVSQVTAGLRLV